MDNGSTDGTVAVVEAWRDRLPPVRIVDAAAEPGLNYARNRGAEAAAGDLLAFADGDDEAVEGWLEGLVSAAEDADLVGGPLDGEALNGHLPDGWIPHDRRTELALGYGFLPYVPGGNCAVWADVARDVRWNENYAMGGSDVEFSWRVRFAGGTLAFAPAAVMRRRDPTGLADLAGKYFRYGLAAPRVYREFRAAGMPPYNERRGRVAVAVPRARRPARGGEPFVPGQVGEGRGRKAGTGGRQREPASALPVSAHAPPAAWLLAGRTLPVSAPTADEQILARLEEWLAELGFAPVPFRAGRRGDRRRIVAGGWRAAVRGLLLTPRLAYLARRERPRVVLTNTAVTAPALAAIKLVLGRRVHVMANVVGLQSVELAQITPGRLRRALYAPVLRLLEALMFRSADVVLTVNDAHAEVIRRRSPRTEVVILSDGGDPALADTRPADRGELGLPEDVLAGRLRRLAGLRPAEAPVRGVGAGRARRKGRVSRWSWSETGRISAPTHGWPPAAAGSLRASTSSVRFRSPRRSP